MFTYKKKAYGGILIGLGVAILLITLASATLVLGIVGLGLIIGGVCGIVSENKKADKFNAKAAELEAQGMLDGVKEAMANGTAKEFKKLKIVVTPREVVTCGDDFNVIKYEFFRAAYVTNIFGNEYDYDRKGIALDMNNGVTYPIAIVLRRKNEEFDEALTLIRNYKALEGGNE